MTQEQKRRIQEYIVIFKNLLIPHLKPTVAVATTIYPYATGVVLLFQLNLEANTSTRFEKESHNLRQVIDKYRLDTKGISISELQSQHSIIFSGQSILSVKSYDSNQWEEEIANTVVNKIVSIIENKICQSNSKKENFTETPMN